MAIDAGDVHDDVNRERDRLADATMRETHVRREHAVRQTREGLLGRVCMDGAGAPEMAGVQRLEEIEGFGAAHFTDEDAVRSVAQRGSEEIGDGDGRKGRLVSNRRLGTPRSRRTTSGFQMNSAVSR